MYVMKYYLPNQSSKFIFRTRRFDELKQAIAIAKANNCTITSISRGDKNISLKAFGYEEEIYHA